MTPGKRLKQVTLLGSADIGADLLMDVNKVRKFPDNSVRALITAT
jgi:hypothetical protein